jgi:hypothetical protein
MSAPSPAPPTRSNSYRVSLQSAIDNCQGGERASPAEMSLHHVGACDGHHGQHRPRRLPRPIADRRSWSRGSTRSTTSSARTGSTARSAASGAANWRRSDPEVAVRRPRGAAALRGARGGHRWRAFDVWSQPAPNGTRFDPCGYVKGWSVQRAARLMRGRAAHSTSASTRAATSRSAAATTPAPPGAWVCATPFEPHGAWRWCCTSVGPLAVATSGTYERVARTSSTRAPVCAVHRSWPAPPSSARTWPTPTPTPPTLCVLGEPKACTGSPQHDRLQRLRHHRATAASITTDEFNRHRAA